MNKKAHCVYSRDILDYLAPTLVISNTVEAAGHRVKYQTYITFIDEAIGKIFSSMEITVNIFFCFNLVRIIFFENNFQFLLYETSLILFTGDVDAKLLNIMLTHSVLLMNMNTDR